MAHAPDAGPTAQLLHDVVGGGARGLVDEEEGGAVARGHPESAPAGLGSSPGASVVGVSPTPGASGGGQALALDAVQEIQDAAVLLDAVIAFEMEVRDVLHSQVRAQLALDEMAGVVEGADDGVALGVGAHHGHAQAGVPQVG